MKLKDSFLLQNEKENNIYIAWDSKFELGIPVIDAQHKKLVELCNNLYNALMNKETTGTPDYKFFLEKALHECVDYVKTHFKNEETLLQAANYKFFSDHKKEHEAFVKKILETVQNFDSISFSLSIQFVKFLYNWILTHIAHEDKLYVKDVLDYYRDLKNKK